jgi:predicted DNA-binding transcriptional regulator AlpA
MADKSSSSQRYLRTPEAARLLGLSGRTLEKHRTHGTGPSYRKLGGRVVYTIEDLQAWADIGLRQSTSDRGRGVIHAAKPVPGLGRLAAHRSR